MECAELVRRLSGKRGRDWSEREIRQILDCLRPIMQRAFSVWSNLRREDIEDCHYHAFIDLWSGYDPNRRGAGDLRTWYGTLLKQRLSHVWTAQKHDASLEQMQSEGHEPLAEDNVEQSVLSVQMVQKCIDQLSDTYRETFILHFLYGLGHDEIAVKLGISIDNSKQRLHRAKSELRNILADEYDVRKIVSGKEHSNDAR